MSWIKTEGPKNEESMWKQLAQTDVHLVTFTSSKCLQLSVGDVASWEEHMSSMHKAQDSAPSKPRTQKVKARGGAMLGIQ